MEHNFLKTAISNCFSIRTDIFGDESVYEGFREIETNRITVDGYNSTLCFAQIIYKKRYDDNDSKSKPVLIKTMPKSKMTKFISNSFINEMNFYAKVIPTLSKLNNSFSLMFAEFYHAEMSFTIEEDHSVIILEDLKARGYRMADKKFSLDRPHLIMMMRKLGQFHAYSYKAKNDMPKWFHILSKNILEANFIANMEFQGVLSITGQRGYEYLLRKNPYYKKYSQSIETMLRNADEIYIRALSVDEENPISVICHGDYLRNNVMFKYAENNIPDDMIFIDLATYRFASPVIDLMTVLYFSADQPTRNELWDTLIDEYYSALVTTFPNNRVPSKNQILSEFIGKAFYAYLAASYFLPTLVATDYNVPAPDYDQILSVEQRTMELHQLPKEVFSEMCLVTGGEPGTRALSDVLRDIIDRGFICK